MFEIANSALTRFWSKFTDFIPDFFGGLLILIVGLILAGLLKRILLTIIRFFKVGDLVEKSRLMVKTEFKIWEEILAEILRWTVIILFLIPTLEVWKLSHATLVLNQLLFYLPNVIVAVIIGFVGIVTGNLSANLVRHSTKSFSQSMANALAVFSRSIIIFFTVLIILNQLGVAQDLIRILFTGIVAMLAIAGGLAFGLGGKELAKEMLDGIKEKLK